jgi:hypothetical protein
MIEEKLKRWFDELTIPRPELSNMPICPFAKPVIKLQEYTIEETDLDSIAFQVSNANVQVYKVCIFYLPNYEIYEVEALEAKTELLNRTFRSNNKVVLDNDPRSPFTINGITTNFPDCYIWVVQDLEDLLSKSNNLKLTNYYNYWTEEQLNGLAEWRTPTET